MSGSGNRTIVVRSNERNDPKYLSSRKSRLRLRRSGIGKRDQLLRLRRDLVSLRSNEHNSSRQAEPAMKHPFGRIATFRLASPVIWAAVQFLYVATSTAQTRI